MIDRVVGHDDYFDVDIYMSDLYPYENYIGYENENGDVILF